MKLDGNKHQPLNKEIDMSYTTIHCSSDKADEFEAMLRNANYGCAPAQSGANTMHYEEINTYLSRKLVDGKERLTLDTAGFTCPNPKVEQDLLAKFSTLGGE